MGADEGRVRVHAENPERLIVCQDDLTACVEHAKAVRHVVEGRVQPRRECCGLLLRGDHPVEIRSEAFGRSLHVKNQRRDAHDNPHGIPTARDEHGCTQRSKSGHKLHIDAAINGVTAGHQAEGVGDGHRHADKLSETVVRYEERKQSPQREAEQAEEGAKRENPFLMARNFDGGARHAPGVATAQSRAETSRSRSEQQPRTTARAADANAATISPQVTATAENSTTGTTSSSKPSTKAM